MRTESILLQNLCIPCSCRCRYCLLSWDGNPVGIPWEGSLEFARGFKAWLQGHMPEIRFSFAFGYSMEHPDLRKALGFLREIGSPQAEFLQCDGMSMRTAAECGALAEMLAEEGVKHLNFTFYGLPEYHDRFAARPGDFALMLRMLGAAKAAGLDVSAGIPLTGESAPQADALIRILEEAACERITLFVPHEEGRGAALHTIRLSEDDLETLSPAVLKRFNRSLYRREGDWVTGGAFTEETRRTLLISLRRENIGRYEAMSPGELIGEAEALDEAYYSAFPTLPELAELYGDPEGRRFYRQRDLFHHYRRRFAAEHGVSVYDVTDERQTGSRRT